MLRASAKQLAVRVIDTMYADPFWMSRFGDRGRERSEEDIAYHAEYLAQALEANDPGIMARYSVWLRSVLTSRGMCSRHLEESFERFEAALPAEIAAESATAMLAARTPTSRPSSRTVIWCTTRPARCRRASRAPTST